MDNSKQLTPKGRAILQAVKDWSEALKKENEARTRVEGFISEYERHKAESARNAFERVPTA